MHAAAAAHVLAIVCVSALSVPVAALSTLGNAPRQFKFKQADAEGGNSADLADEVHSAAASEMRRGQVFFHDEQNQAQGYHDHQHDGEGETSRAGAAGGGHEYQHHRTTNTQAGFTCREKLHHDGECCVDNNFGSKVEGVSHAWIERPNTSWSCEEDWCYDDRGGRRGQDLMWWPEGSSCHAPRLLYVHGGSWYFGSPNTTGYETFGAKLAKYAFATVMVIDYPLAPKHHWKDMAHFTLRALEYLATHGRPGCENKPGKGPPLLLGGDSSGAGLGYSVLLALTRSGSKLSLNGGADKVAGAFFFSPWMNLKCNTPTYASNVYSNVTLTGSAIPPTIRWQEHPEDPQRNGAAPASGAREAQVPEDEITWHLGDVLFPTRRGWQIKECVQNAEDYVGDMQLLDSPLVSPIWAYPKMMSGMPPLLLTVGASEVLLGDVIMAAQVAAAGGVEVVMDVYDGMWHDFQMYSEGCGGSETLWEGILAIRRTARFIRDVVHTGHPPCGKGVLGVPRTTWHMTRPGTNSDWVPGNGNPDRFICPPTYKDTLPTLKVPDGKRVKRETQDILTRDALRAKVAQSAAHPGGASSPPDPGKQPAQPKKPF